jgi:peptidoglycan/xylan/chitin deacetylase (PgdA/CDA1 family)
MNRREFTKTLGLTGVAIGLNKSFLSSSSVAPAPQFAVTMDDFVWHNAVHLTAEDRNRAILDVLSAQRAKAALFVVGENAEEERGKTMLKKWDDAGHIIGNHTYSHRSLSSRITIAEYEQDILRAETVLKDFKQFRRLFRYPLLKEGDTAAKRDQVHAFLKLHHYRIGHVTIDNSDWIVDQRLKVRLQKDPNADTKPYRDFYLDHMWDRAQYYDALGKRVLGRPVKHTILTHFNLLNGLFLGELIEMFKSKGWQLIDAEDAFTDPVFQAEPKILPAGESIVWSLAKAAGKIPISLRYPAEDGDYETAKMDKLGL